MWVSARSWLSRVAREGALSLREIPPPALLALLCAATVSPLLTTVTGLSADLIAGSNVLAGLGGGVLSGILTEMVSRPSKAQEGKDKGIPLDQAAAEKQIADEIGRVLAVGDATSGELRAEIAELLRRVDIGTAALTAALEEGSAQVRDDILAAIAALGTDFTEFGFLLRDIVRGLADQGRDIGFIIEQNERQSADIRLLREDVAVALGRRAGPDATAGLPVGSSRVPGVGEYLAAVQRASAEHPYFGGALETPALDVVYVQQLADRQHGEEDSQDTAFADSGRLPVPDVLSAEGTCVVLAGPGGGKSSLLRACAAASAGGWSEGSADAAIPVLVHAVELVGAALFDAAAKAVTAELSRFGLTSTLTAGFFTDRPCVFFVDGIDEITSAGHRRDLLSELNTIARDGHPVIRFVLATRPLPPGELDLLGPSVVRYDLRRFTRDDVLNVASAWFAALAMPDAAAATAAFAAALARRARLPELARTPLMAAMLCQLFADNPDRELPGSRGAIYREFRDLLIRHLKAEGLSGAYAQAEAAMDRYGPQARNRAAHVLNQLPVLVGELAVQRHRGVTGRTLGIIAALPDAQVSDDIVPEADWHAYLDATLRRSGLLVPRAGDFVFLHRTVQDYLAARHVIRTSAGQAYLREALRIRKMPLARWKLPSEDISFLSFLIDPGEGDSSAGSAALEHIAARGGLDGSHFIAALVQLGTEVPATVIRRAARSLETIARHSHSRYNRDPVDAARTLADLDQARGLDLLSSLATRSGYSDDGLNAIREITMLDTALAADLLETLATSTESYYVTRLRAARLLFRLDQERGTALLEQLASGESPHRIDPLYVGQLLADLDPARAGDVLERLILDTGNSHWDRGDWARTLAGIDQDRAVSALERALRDTTDPYYKRERLALFLAEIDRPHAIEFIGSVAQRSGSQSSQRHWAEETLRLIRESATEGADSVSQQRDALRGLLDQADSVSQLLDQHDELWLNRELHRLTFQRITGRGAKITLTDVSGRELPDGIPAGLDDPRAADLLYQIATDPAKATDFGGITAAWQLARIRDPRAADLVAALARDSTVSWLQRKGLITTLYDLEPALATELMSSMAAEPDLTRHARREIAKAQAGLVARRHPGPRRPGDTESAST
jgi:hypothetical protein